MDEDEDRYPLHGYPWPRDEEQGRTYLLGPNDETWEPDEDSDEDEA